MDAGALSRGCFVDPVLLHLLDVWSLQVAKRGRKTAPRRGGEARGQRLPTTCETWQLRAVA